MIPYSRAHINACSSKLPMHPSIYLKSLFEATLALESIRMGTNPQLVNWVSLAAMVNTMDALKQQNKIYDDAGLIADSVTALAESSIRASEGKAFRLDDKGIQAIAGVVTWRAYLTDKDNQTFWADSPIRLVAAMRCYVASKLGDEVEIPDELLTSN